MFSRTPEKAKELIEEYFGDQNDNGLGSVEEYLDLFTSWLQEKDLNGIEIDYILVEWITELSILRIETVKMQNTQSCVDQIYIETEGKVPKNIIHLVLVSVRFHGDAPVLIRRLAKPEDEIDRECPSFMSETDWQEMLRLNKISKDKREKLARLKEIFGFEVPIFKKVLDSDPDQIDIMKLDDIFDATDPEYDAEKMTYQDRSSVSISGYIRLKYGDKVVEIIQNLIE